MKQGVGTGRDLVTTGRRELVANRRDMMVPMVEEWRGEPLRWVHDRGDGRFYPVLHHVEAVGSGNTDNVSNYPVPMVHRGKVHWGRWVCAVLVVIVLLLVAMATSVHPHASVDAWMVDAGRRLFALYLGAMIIAIGGTVIVAMFGWIGFLMSGGR